MEQIVLRNGIVIVFWWIIQKFQTNITLTRIECEFSTNCANSMIVVSFERRKSQLLNDTKIVQIGCTERKL